MCFVSKGVTIRKQSNKYCVKHIKGSLCESLTAFELSHN